MVERFYQNEIIPRMLTVRQCFSRDALVDPAAEIDRCLLRPEIYGSIKPGMTVAITAGSRGIENMPLMIKKAVELVKARGGFPFIIPAMGSHGGATAEGQTKLLEGYGITERTMGAPVRATMEVEQIATLPDGRGVYIDAFANSADGIIVINRIKEHTAFKAERESGIYKMMAIGLGKQYGASVVHGEGSPAMGRNIKLFGESILKHANILFALACIDNAFHHTAEIRSMTPQEIPTAEPEMLVRAKSLMPRFLLDDISVLVIDRIGKDISGTGFDVNITDSFAPECKIYPTHRPQRIAVLDLTENSHGCANGIGGADVVCKRAVEKYDVEASYANAFTARSSTVPKIPMTFKSDEDTIKAAVALTYGADKTKLRMVRIEDTLHMETIQISEAMLPDALAHADIEVLDSARKLSFDKNGNLF